MSSMATFSRVGASYSAIYTTLTEPWIFSRSRGLQIRHYAVQKGKSTAKGSEKGTPKKAAQMSKSFRGAQSGGPRGSKKKDQNLGFFHPMPVGQLSQEVFHSSSRSVPTLNLPEFQAKILKRSMIGKAAVFPERENDAYRIFGLPKTTLLEFRLLSKPCSVIRDITVTAIDMLDQASEASSLETRVVLSGRSGTGKSYLLLQAVEYCLSQNWIVLYIPRGVSLVNSTTPHTYDIRTQTYLQPLFAYQTLDRLLKVNSVPLASLQTQQTHTFERNEVTIGTPLSDLIRLGLENQTLASVILDILMRELEQQTTHPVLLAVDEFQALYCQTAYRDPHFNRIRSYHLSMPRLIMDFASGNRSFKRGAVLGAINSSDPNYSLSLELRDALHLPHDQPASPWDKRSRALIEYTKGLRALSVPEYLSLEEAASIFELWMKDKALISLAYDELFMAKYSESSGNPRMFVWKGLLSSLET